MYKYTANAKLLEIWRRKKGDEHFRFAFYIAGSDYTVYCALQRFWSSTVFFSPKRLTFVPVGGYLLPVNLFDEVKV